MFKKEKIAKQLIFKSFDWSCKPDIADSLFREYDLRNPLQPMEKKGKKIEAGVNIDGFRILGQAYGSFVLRKLKQKSIVVGNDYRSYSRGLVFAFITGALSAGVNVIDIGTCLTPVMYFSQHYFKFKGGAIITASHNDNGWSGLKLAKDLSKTFEPADIIYFKKLVYAGNFTKGAGQYRRFYEIKNFYLADIVKRYKKIRGANNLKVVVGTGNGGAGEFLPDLIAGLGFKVIKANCELDWDFPLFNPDPENIEFLHSLGREVVKNKADLGIAADGDGDRFGVVDEQGHEIFSDRAGLFISRYLSEKNKNQTIVIDVKSTGAYALDPVLKKNLIKVVFSPTGHSYVKAKSHKLDALAGFEKSGHFFLRHGYGYGYDDACLSAAAFCSILSRSKEKLSALIALQPKSFQSPTMHPAVANDLVKYQIVEKAAKEILNLKKQNKFFAGQKIKELITVNGTRVVLADGSWGLIRASSNMPILVIVMESFSTKQVLKNIFEKILNILKKYGVKKTDFDQLIN